MQGFIVIKLHLQLKKKKLILMKYKYLSKLAYCMTTGLCCLQPRIVVVLLMGGGDTFCKLANPHHPRKKKLKSYCFLCWIKQVMHWSPAAAAPASPAEELLKQGVRVLIILVGMGFCLPSENMSGSLVRLKRARALKRDWQLGNGFKSNWASIFSFMEESEDFRQN